VFLTAFPWAERRAPAEATAPGTWRGIIIMSVTNRAHVRASAIGLTILTVMIALCFFYVGGTARALDDDKAQAEALKALEGTWRTDEGGGIEAKWIFMGTSLKATVNGMDYTCRVKLDPAAKPLTADFLIDEGPEDTKGKTSKAIYKLDGDKLTICVSHPGKDRPKDFAEVPDEAVLLEMKKQKKD
jgi:uncharacterized protein (TIGR03067 family)